MTLHPSGERSSVSGPWFEDLAPGDVFEDAPGLTLTSGHAAIHQAIAGDRFRLPLDARLSADVTGRAEPLAHPNLVCDIAIGQSTGPSQRVLGNLFYRGLVLQRPAFVGDTLRTRTEIVAMKQNRPRADAPATGLVVLHVRTLNQDDEPVLDFFRCPMIPLRDARARTRHTDSIDAITELDMGAVRRAVPTGWRLAPLRARTPGPHAADLVPGTVFEIEGADTVTSAPELARLTLNVAMAHTDPTSTGHGRRLVYGGHTISIAAAHAARALPGLATILAWRGCDHLRPVFEGDVLRTELHVEGVEELEDGGLADLRAVVYAIREDAQDAVLDWRFIGLLA